ncbi:MAG: hypothetical protein WAM73_01800 [Desulfobacterales bacterium]
MIIDDLKSGTENGRKRVSAKVAWEDSDRPQQEIFIETDPEFADGLSANPHAFLTVYSFYPDLIEPLRNAGRGDLADILQKKLAAYLNPPVVKKPLRRKFVDVVYKMDQDYLNSSMRRIKHTFQSR